MNNNLIAFQDLARIKLVSLACMDWDTHMRVPTGDGSEGDLLKCNLWMDDLILQNWDRHGALYLNSSDAQSDWIVRVGSLAEHPDIIVDSATLSNQCFTNDEPLHIFALPEEKGLTAKLVISPQLFNRFSFQLSLDNQVCLWKEYIVRPPAHQSVLDTLYSNPYRSKDLLGCLSYVMSFVADGYNCTEDGILEMLARNYSRDHSRTPVLPQELIGLVDILAIRRYLRPMDPWLRWPTDAFLEFLALYSVVNGCSHFTAQQPDPVLTLVDDRPQRGPQILAACLPYICPTERYQQIMHGLMEQAPLDSHNANYATELLFLCLLQPSHSTEMKYHICDSLFSTSIACYQIPRIAEVLQSPFGNDIAAHINSCFEHSCTTGKFSHFYAASAIFIHQKLSAHHNPLAEAQQLVLHSHDKRDIVLGLYTISLVLWAQTMNEYAFSAIRFSPSPALTDRITEILSDPETDMYAPACCAAEDLVLSGYIPPERLNHPEIWNTAIHLIAAGQSVIRAQRLISLMPFTVPKTSPADLRGSYLGQFERALTPGGDSTDLSVLFGVCANLGCWSRSQQMQAFNQMCRHISRRKLDSEERQRLQLLGQQLLPMGMSGLETDSGLSDFDAAQETEYSGSTLASPEQTYRFLHSLYSLADPRSALEQQTFPSEITGSYLITTWFYALCRLGCAQKALDFYREHTDILNRPASYDPILLQSVTHHSFQSSNYVRFFGGPSRLSIGLRLSLLMKKPEVLELFLLHFPHIQQEHFAVELSMHLSKNNLKTLNRVYNYRYPLTGITPKQFLSMQNQLFRLDRRYRESRYATKIHYEDFYDDRSVLLHALRTDPKSHATVFSCGYASDTEMALAAVSAQGDSLRFLRPSLRFDPTICRVALQTSTSALRYIPKELLGTPEELLAALNGRKFSLKGLPKAFTDHKEFVLAALRHNGNELRYASARMKRDWDVVLATIAGRKAVNPAVSLPLYYADPALLENKEFILKAAKVNPSAVYCASAELKECPEIKTILDRLDAGWE